MKSKAFTLIIFIGVLFHTSSFCMSNTQCSQPGGPSCTYDGHTQPNQPDLLGPPGSIINPFGCTSGSDCPSIGSSMMKLSDLELLNLKSNISNPNGRVATANAAINITQSDFEGFVQAGKSILFSQGFFNHFYMNIGVADAVNAQTWTLPANLTSYVDGLTTQVDILSPNSIPLSLQIAGTTHVLKRIEPESNGEDVDNYMHLQIDGTEVTDLGTSYDFDEGSDDIFDEEPDVELYDVPLNLGDSQTTEDFPIDEVTNVNYLKINIATTVDAFGIINTPYGSFDCLRQTEITKYFRRANGTASFGTVPNYEIRRIKWITKNGFIFSAAVQSEDVNHIGLLGFAELTRFVPTNTLTSASAVKINNDSFGISINNTDFYPHESAILDINSDSLGVLIPRISMANRPSSPAEGLLVYQVDNTPGFYYFDGTTWQRLSSQPPVGVSARVSSNLISKNLSIHGKNQLQNGSAFIKFDTPRDDFEDLMIIIQLEGDCNGVYISRKTREGFEVKELQKGKSNVKFSWSLN
ncbi:MAG: hypothetical protein ACK4NY_12145 [Spirosomataceae bacterium]